VARQRLPRPFLTTLVERFHELCRHRDRVALFVSDESADAKEARRQEADKSDEHLVRRLAELGIELLGHEGRATVGS
jgi:hypothetical protein